MVEKILGNFLVETGRISEEQLKEIIQKQDTTRVKLGFIAVAQGMLTVDQANEINRLQQSMDKRFGTIAVEKGYLTDDQVDALLEKQGNPYLTFTQALVDAGLIQMEDMDGLLREFREKNGFTEEQLTDIRSGETDRIVPLYLPAEAGEMNQLIGTVIRTLIRLVDRNTYIGKAYMTKDFPQEKQVNQSLIWESGIVDCFSEGNGGLLTLCSTFAHEDFPELDMDALDSAGELLNCANGLFVSALSRQGEFLEIIPPSYGEPEGEIKEGRICCVPIFLGEQQLFFTAAELEQED